MDARSLHCAPFGNGGHLHATSRVIMLRHLSGEQPADAVYAHIFPLETFKQVQSTCCNRDCLRWSRFPLHVSRTGALRAERLE